MATALTTRPRLREQLGSGQRSFSFEFFPPKDDTGERRLWTAIRELEPLDPTFVSVTYGAGGSTRVRTVRITARIAAETTLRPVGHLTCVGQEVAELRAVVGRYADAGVRDLLVLRGDPPAGPGTPWRQHPGGLRHAVQLVDLVRELGDFTVGVAAFPEGHPEAPSLVHDARVLAAKARAGADFAVTQLLHAQPFDRDPPDSRRPGVGARGSGLRERASPRLTRRATRPDPSPSRSEVSWCVVAYQGAGTAILADMRVRPSVGKVSLGLVAVVAGLGCCVLVGALVLELLAADVRPRAVLAAWSAGITAVVLTILALQEHGDPDDDPRYFATLVHGLRQEWHR